MNDLNIVGGTIVRPEGCFEGSVEVKGGAIAAVKRAGEAPAPAAETVDAAGMLVFPGMIDSHVHIRGGRLSHREDFASGTMAAAAGGVTALAEMPVANPPASTAEAFEARRAEAQAAAYVDIALYGGAGADNLDEIEKLAGVGAVAYKTFTMPPVPGREAEFYGLCSETQDALCRVMERVEKTGRLRAVHSVLNLYVAAETTRRMDAGENGLVAFCRSRPVEAETAAVEWVIEAARKTGCRASVCHVSTPEAVRMIEAARAQGVRVWAETCPQYILFSEQSAAHAGVFARMKPPLRDGQRMRQLRRMYENGSFAMTGSDHAPYLREEKLKNGQDIWHTFDGLPGLELSLPLLLNAAADGTLSFEAIAKATAESTAQMLGLAPKKGRIEAGADADMVLVAKNEAPVPLDTSRLFTKARDSAALYEGIPMHYRVARTYVRGQAVYAEGRITGKQGWGTFVSPAR